MKIKKLKKKFPFYNEFSKFIEEYTNCYTYWYITKARSLRDKNQIIAYIKSFLKILFEHFLGEKWNQDTQDRILTQMMKENILSPYKKGKKSDRTALPRIHKVFWETLGLVWLEENSEIIITDVGLDLLSQDDSDKFQRIIEGQIAKWQYPNPNMDNSKDFDGILCLIYFLCKLYNSWNIRLVMRNLIFSLIWQNLKMIYIELQIT